MERSTVGLRASTMEGREFKKYQRESTPARPWCMGTEQCYHNISVLVDLSLKLSWYGINNKWIMTYGAVSKNHTTNVGSTSLHSEINNFMGRQRGRYIYSWDLKRFLDYFFLTEEARIFNGSEFQTSGAWYWKDCVPALFKLKHETANCERKNKEIWKVCARGDCD